MVFCARDVAKLEHQFLDLSCQKLAATLWGRKHLYWWRSVVILGASGPHLGLATLHFNPPGALAGLERFFLCPRRYPELKIAVRKWDYEWGRHTESNAIMHAPTQAWSYYLLAPYALCLSNCSLWSLPTICFSLDFGLWTWTQPSAPAQYRCFFLCCQFLGFCWLQKHSWKCGHLFHLISSYLTLKGPHSLLASLSFLVSPLLIYIQG